MKIPALLSTLATTILASALAAQARLNGPLARANSTGVTRSLLLSADGGRVLFRGEESAGVIELFSVPSDGSAPYVRLHGPLGGNQDVAAGLALGALDATVFFRAPTGAGASFELLGAPVDGSSAPLVLSGMPVAGGNVLGFALTPDRARLVYRADQEDDERFGLWSVPADGSAAPLRLHAPLAPNADVLTFQATADSTRVVFRGDLLTNLVDELFVAPLDGSAPELRLNAPGQNVLAFQLSPDSSQVTYVVAGAGLWHAALAGGAPVRLDDLGLDEAALARDFRFTPDSARVIYRVESLGTLAPGLFSVVPGSAPMRLDAGLAPGEGVLRFRATPDSVRIVFAQRRSSEELWSAPSDGSLPATRLDQPTYTTPTIGVFEPTSDSSAVLFTTTTAYALEELFRVPLDGSAAPLLLSLPTPLQNVLSLHLRGDQAFFVADRFFGAAAVWRVPEDGSLPAQGLTSLGGAGVRDDVQVSADGSLIAYVERAMTPLVEGLHTLPSDLSRAPLRVGLPVVPGAVVGDTQPPELTPSGSHCLYLADDELEGFRNLFAVELAPGFPRRRVNEPSGTVFEYVQYFRLSPRGDRVAYIARIDGYDQVFSAPLDGSSPPLELTPSGLDLFLLTLEFSADGEHLVVVAQTYPDRAYELHGLASDGSSGLVPLHLATGIVDPELTRAGEHVLFVEGIAGARRLFSVRADGTAPVADLTGALVSGGDLREFRLTPDRRAAVFLANKLARGRDELFVVPVDGSTEARRINADVARGHVLTFDLAPDSRWVAYSANHERTEVSELWVVPLDGSRAPAKRSGVLPITADVRQPRIDTRGRVVYVADALVNNRDELWAVPLEGSHAPLRISHDLATGEDVGGDFQLGADGWLVYPVRHATTTLEIRAARADGTVAPRRIDEPASAGILSDFRVQGARVLYRSSRYGGGLELVSALLAVPNVPRRLNAPLVANGDVQNYATAGGRIVYRADQHEDEVFELFALRLPTPPAPQNSGAPTGSASVTVLND